MYSPVHAAAGLLLSQLTPNPYVAFGLGVASHYVLDHLPHGDTRVGPWMVARPSRRMPLVLGIDLGVAALLTWWLISRQSSPDVPRLLAGAIGGITPDLLWGAKFLIRRLAWVPGWIQKILDRHQRWHESTHVKAEHDVPFWAGLWTQIILVVGLALLYR